MGNRVGVESIMAESPELRKSLNRYSDLENICLHIQDRVKADSNGKFLKAVPLTIFAEKTKNRKKDEEEFFDDIKSKLNEFCFLDIVSTFEKLVFKKLENALGNVRAVVKKGYQRKDPFGICVVSFIKDKDDIRYLGGLSNILKGHLVENLRSDMNKIIDYRNRLAHGDRSGEEIQLTLNETVEILETILEKVG